jgi:hypothetical protein
MIGRLGVGAYVAGWGVAKKEMESIRVTVQGVACGWISLRFKLR